MNQKELKIEVPKGFEIDQVNSTFEKIVFKETKKDIKDRIKNFDDVLKELGSSDDDVINYKVVSSNNISKFILASLQIKMIAKVLNEGWIPNWENNSEYKWYPWVSLNQDNELPLDSCLYCVSYACCSAHFCFKSKDVCEYALKTFSKEYSEYFKINS